MKKYSDKNIFELMKIPINELKELMNKLIKSKDGDKALQILEDTLGKELMDMLNNFYKDTVINQQQNSLEESKVL